MTLIGKLCFVVALSTFFLPSVSTADLSPLLSKIAQAIECSQKESNPTWRIERNKPIRPNEKTLIEMLVSGGRRVKVSILEHETEAAAIETMKRGSYDKSAKAFPNLGDEAYSWGYNEAIAFRKGNLTVYVSAFSDIESLLPGLNDTERSDLRRSEEKAINKSLARVIANVLSNLDRACQSMDRA